MRNDILDNHLYVADVGEMNNEINDGLKAHSGVYDNHNNSCYLSMLNLTNEKIEIQANQIRLYSILSYKNPPMRTYLKVIN